MMKKTVLFLALLMIASVASAQFTFGPKVGFSASKLSTDFPEMKEQAKANFQIGAFARFGKKFYVQPELMYATNGGIFKDEETGGKQRVKFQSVEIPVLVGFRLVNLEVMNLRVFLGPSGSFFLGKDVEVDNVLQETFNKDSFKNVSWGMNLGAGVDVLFLTLDLRYQWGLNNVYEAPADEQSYMMKNNLFIVSLGFKLL